mgnify:CR=1 FL=1
MIKVNYVVSNNLIKSVSIKGHAFYDTYGKDIVCAAVSSIVTTTINDILALTEDKIKYDTQDGNVLIGDSEYKPVCSYHYWKYNNNF